MGHVVTGPWQLKSVRPLLRVLPLSRKPFVPSLRPNHPSPSQRSFSSPLSEAVGLFLYGCGKSFFIAILFVFLVAVAAGCFVTRVRISDYCEINYCDEAR